MTDPSWLIDTSAYNRLYRARDETTWLSRIDRGLVHVSTVTLLELGFSARNVDSHDAIVTGAPADLFVREHLRPAHEDRAIEVQRELAVRGQHRGVSIPDLLLAAIAELSQLVVLHIDRDFDLIAAVTGQPVERLEIVE